MNSNYESQILFVHKMACFQVAFPYKIHSHDRVVRRYTVTMSPNRQKHRDKHFKSVAINAELAQLRPSVNRSDHIVGHKGRRRGWRNPIELEIGTDSIPEDRFWRQAVLQRDGYRCVFCGSTQNLEADHIKPKIHYPEFRFHVENGRTLCHRCHAATETYGQKVHSIVSVGI